MTTMGTTEDSTSISLRSTQPTKNHLTTDRKNAFTSTIEETSTIEQTSITFIRTSGVYSLVC